MQLKKIPTATAKALMALLLLMGTVACDDFLDIEPREEISIDQQFSTWQGAQQALNSAYLNLEAQTSGIFFLYADLQGGNITFSPLSTGSNLGQLQVPSQVDLVYNFNDNALDTAFRTFYAGCYSIIYNTNTIIGRADQLPDASSGQKEQLKAEAYAMRAYLHYQLLQLYGQPYAYTADASHPGIVYADRLLVAGVDFPSRLSVKQSYEKIVADYELSLELMQSESALQGPAHSFFNRGAVMGLLARTHLQSRNWQQARQWAQAAIDESGKSLTPKETYVEEWMHPTAPLTETLLELTAPLNTEGTGVSSSVSEYFRVLNIGTAEVGRYVLSADVTQLFEADDIREELLIVQDRSTQTEEGLQPRAYSFTHKYQDTPGTPVIRLSEMYLIMAEAAARLDDTAAALPPLNVIRNRAGLPSLTVTDNLLQQVLIERRRELVLEGHYFFDLARYGWNVERTNGCLSTLCNLDYPGLRWVLPIPRATININQNVSQNEGY